VRYLLRPICLCLLLILSGCGYTLASRNSSLQGRTIDVAMFANRTYQPDIDALLRLAFVNELTTDGLVVGGKDAGLAISGEIESLLNDATAYSATDTVMLYRVTITITAELLDRKSGKPLWRGTETGRQDYPANTDLALQANARDAAIASVCRSMAKILVTKMGNTF
jgi:hypothetical protein